jgi:hypothetical protein
MIEKIIPLWLKDRTHQTIWLLCLFLTGILWTLPLINTFFSQANWQLQKETVGKLLLSQCFLSLALGASLIISYYKHRTKPKLTDYDYIEDPGFYVHKRTKEKYCGNCIDKHGKLHHLSFHGEKGLICRPCGNSYVSPHDYQSAWKQATQNDKNS